MVLLSTHNICFVVEIRKLILNDAILTRGLLYRDVAAEVGKPDMGEFSDLAAQANMPFT